MAPHRSSSVHSDTTSHCPGFRVLKETKYTYHSEGRLSVQVKVACLLRESKELICSWKPHRVPLKNGLLSVLSRFFAWDGHGQWQRMRFTVSLLSGPLQFQQMSLLQLNPFLMDCAPTKQCTVSIPTSNLQFGRGWSNSTPVRLTSKLTHSKGEPHPLLRKKNRRI